MKINVFGRGRPLRWAIAFTCQIAFIFFGYDQGVMSGLITNVDLLDKLNHPGDASIGFMLSIYNLGCFTGCVLSWLIGDYTGRRNVIFLAMAWVAVGASLQTSAVNLAHLMAGRFITGIGTGLETSTVPVYQSELCEASKRGRLVCSEIMFVGLGLVIAAFFDYGMVRVEGPLGWRLPVGFQLFFALIVTLMTTTLPESPRYLYRKDRVSEANQVLCDVYNREPTDEKVLQEQQAIIDALRIESSTGEYSWRHIFKQDKVQTGKRILLAYGMQFMNQMGGINLVVYYMPTVLQRDIGLSHDLAVLLSGTINVMFLIGSFIPATLADRIGRRKPMMIGSLGCGIAMMCVSILLSFKGGPASHSTSIASVAFFFLFMLIYGATVACVPWAYVPEILPLHVRSKWSALAISSNWTWNFFIVMITPILINSLQWKAYLLFMCLNFAFVPWVYFCYPETANLSLEEVDLLYEDAGVPARIVAKRYQKEKQTQSEDGMRVDQGAGVILKDVVEHAEMKQ